MAPEYRGIALALLPSGVGVAADAVLKLASLKHHPYLNGRFLLGCARTGAFAVGGHARIRRSSVRSTLAGSCGCRRCSSSRIAIARTVGAAMSIGNTSTSKMFNNGSGRRRPRGGCFCDGIRGSASIR